MSNRDTVSVRINPALDYHERHEERLRLEIEALLAQLGFAKERGMKALVRPGDTVLLKPNLVFHGVSDSRAALTSGLMIKVVCDLVLDALEGRGQVVIADVPLQSAQFDEVVRMNGLDIVVAEYRRLGHPVTLLDLRKEYLRVENGIHRGLSPLPGDPLGYAIVNLAEASELEPLAAYRSRFAVGDYDRDSTATYHMSSRRNEYLIPRTVLAADVLVNLPKLKTHIKTGITCALKNLVGTCGHKSYLPHFRDGRPRAGGDEFAVDSPIKELQRQTIDRLKTTNRFVYGMVRVLGRVLMNVAMANERRDLRNVMAGSWFGNDTLWRTVLDLNKIALFADHEGTLHDRPQRRYLCIVDGIWAGEGYGPMRPDCRHDGILLAGQNPVLVDLVACLLMGIDPEGIRQVRRAFDIKHYPLVEQTYNAYRDHLQTFVRSNVWPLPNLDYRLPVGWDGHVPRLEAVQPSYRDRGAAL